MSHPRRLSSLVLAVLVAASAAACVTATPGWTYTPAPSLTPPPSVAPSGSGAASGSSGSAAPSAASGEAGGGGEAIAISALNIAFEQTTVTAPAGKAFQITFDNKDSGVPHNVAVHDSSGAEKFKGEIVTGPATKTYDVPALDAGTYTFVCSVHPNMTGTLTFQ